MSDPTISHSKVVEWSIIALGWLAAAVALIWRRAQSEKDWITAVDADKRYPLRGEVYMREESDRRFANRETCAIQHAFLTERFKEVTDRIASEAAATRALIEALHKGD